MFLTSEDTTPMAARPSLLEAPPKADAIVTAGSSTRASRLGLMPTVERVIGCGTKRAGPAR